MLTTSFELLKAQYLPSFMLAQKYALPIVLSAMTVAFFTFFEPERFHHKKSLTVLRLLMVATCIIHSYFMTTLEIKSLSTGSFVIYIVQWIAIFSEMILSFLAKSNKAAV